jgi:hypothetical protein
MGSSDRRDFSDSRKTGNPKNPRLSRFYRWLAAKWQRSPRLRIGRTSLRASANGSTRWTGGSTRSTVDLTKSTGGLARLPAGLHIRQIPKFASL